MGLFRKYYNETESRIVNILDGCSKLLDAGSISIQKVKWDLYEREFEILSVVLDEYISKNGKYGTEFIKKFIELKEKKQNILGYHLTEA